MNAYSYELEDVRTCMHVCGYVRGQYLMPSSMIYALLIVFWGKVSYQIID